MSALLALSALVVVVPAYMQVCDLLGVDSGLPTSVPSSHPPTVSHPDVAVNVTSVGIRGPEVPGRDKVWRIIRQPNSPFELYEYQPTNAAATFVRRPMNCKDQRLVAPCRAGGQRNILLHSLRSEGQILQPGARISRHIKCRPYLGTLDEDGLSIRPTAFFRSAGPTPISIPPPRDALLEAPLLGDVYVHVVLTDPCTLLLWVRIVDRDARALWLPVSPGYRRDDGCRLTLTPVLRLPSWVSEAYFRQALRGHAVLNPSMECGWCGGHGSGAWEPSWVTETQFESEDLESIDPHISAYQRLAAIYGFLPLPPPPPLSKTPSRSCDHHAPRLEGGIIMAARRIQAALSSDAPRKTPWGIPVPHVQLVPSPIPGWTDGSNAWRASVYGGTVPSSQTAHIRRDDAPIGARDGAAPHQPCCCISPRYQSNGTTFDAHTQHLYDEFSAALFRRAQSRSSTSRSENKCTVDDRGMHNRQIAAWQPTTACSYPDELLQYPIMAVRGPISRKVERKIIAGVEQLVETEVEEPIRRLFLFGGARG
ncbi:hypothetical protein C8Q76DRAFT_798061 [Earliella scabrosa]|nr:hypothetical protein C8Q76DRAFT_798061 [Earliella scabrosa]